MDLEPRSFHIGRAQRILADVGIHMAGMATTEFIALLLATVDAARADEDTGILVDRLLDSRPGWATEILADESVIGRKEGTADAREAVHEFACGVANFHRDGTRYRVPPHRHTAEDREWLLSHAETESQSPDWQLRAGAVLRLYTLDDGEDILERLAGDTHPRVAYEAQRELDRRRPA